jgi:hypothetical protein
VGTSDDLPSGQLCEQSLMTTNYDQIATQYQESKHEPWREWIERYSFLELIGDVTGLSVVDFACGEG